LERGKVADPRLRLAPVACDAGLIAKADNRLPKIFELLDTAPFGED